MSRPPAVVIVARHGARLDAADKQWHLTSPTPYDPPLTYGGWTQCRALGARIASLLQAREELSEDPQHGGKEQHGTDPETNEQQNGDGPHTPKKRQHQVRRRKHKITIHSSPFLRCIQTSIAISAGISQYQGQHESPAAETHSKKPSLSLETPPRAHPGFSSSPLLAPIPDEDPRPPGPTSQPSMSTRVHPHLKPKLRVDAFLGEWLSPDYYENITPPPGSLMMVAGAKADLLRRGDHVETYEDPSKLASTKGNFPGGWGSLSGPGTPEMKPADKLVDDVSKIALKSPRRDRASTVNSNGVHGHEDSHALRVSPTSHGYTPPVPRYAISPSEPIPGGYVNHARDACIEVDYQWDSMRDPQNWGDGGEYGEEWSQMHKRFRKGLQKMIDWYRIHHETANQVGGHKRVLHPQPQEDDDDNTDTVLILVSHGAGCNALIGALTNQPVLMDVSMASLTMALRRDNQPHSSDTSSASDRLLSTEYRVELAASTDHLRAQSSSQPLTIPLLANGDRSQNINTLTQASNTIASALGPRVAPRRNTRHDTQPPRTIAHTSSPFSPPDTPPQEQRRTAIGLHRSSSAAASRSTHGLERSNSGLWSRPTDDEKPRRTWTLGQSDAQAERDKFNARSGSGMWGESAISSGTPSGAQTPEREIPTNGTWNLWSKAASPPPRDVPTFPGAPLPSKVDGDGGSGGGLWGGAGKGLPKQGMSAMAMALRGDDGRQGWSDVHRGAEEEGEVREREMGQKRRWTVNERGDLLG